MLYTVTLMGDTWLARREFGHIADALSFVTECTRGAIQPIDLVTDVVQLGEYLECVSGVWIRVIKGALH